MTPGAALERLKKRREFVRVTRLRKHHATPGLILQAAPRMADGDDGQARNDTSALRVGFTVSRKVGGAVVRNRAKRRLRAVAECVLAAHAAPGYDYVLVGRKSTPGRAFDALANDLETALKRLHLYRVDDDAVTDETRALRNNDE